MFWYFLCTSGKVVYLAWWYHQERSEGSQKAWILIFWSEKDFGVIYKTANSLNYLAFFLFYQYMIWYKELTHKVKWIFHLNVHKSPEWHHDIQSHHLYWTRADEADTIKQQLTLSVSVPVLGKAGHYLFIRGERHMLSSFTSLLLVLAGFFCSIISLLIIVFVTTAGHPSV